MKKVNYTKKDIAKDLSVKTGYSNIYSKKIINDLTNILIHQIKDGGLKYKNFGSFKLINKNQRMGRNPKTGENFIIKPRKQVSFKASNFLLKLLETE